MKLTSLFSGSSGNCLLFEHGKTKILIDAGLSGNKIQQMLRYAEVDPMELSAILITHEHDDHISGAGILSRRFKLPIYANQPTMRAMGAKLGKIEDKNRVYFKTGEKFSIMDVEITSFHSSHDAIEPVGFTFTDGKKAIGIATDIGIITNEIADALKNCRAVLLEANHDVDMLMRGSYPYYLKKRILSELGHLSNEDSGRFCCELIKNGTEKIILGHLSQQNNTPLTALGTVSDITGSVDIKRGKDFLLYVARRDTISESIEIL